jgi:hypothetical protein
MLLGAALASRQAFAEIVHYALADDETESRAARRRWGCSTPSGRIVGAPSASPSGRLWVTRRLDHAFVDAIGQLVGLANVEGAASRECNEQRTTQSSSQCRSRKDGGKERTSTFKPVRNGLAGTADR